MTREEAVQQLDGCQYREEGSRELFAAMKAAGLVAIFGASDDLMEFRGAIDDEISAWEGVTAHLTSKGLLQNDCDNDDCPHFAKMQKAAATIRAIWNEGPYAWQYETEIPCARFIVKEDDDLYCQGIVFALADVRP